VTRNLRDQYWSTHSTEVDVFKCMDGRLDFSYATETPVGIVQPYRNIGGRFDLAWPYLGRIVKDRINAVHRRGHDYLAIAAYHYSKGETHRGCKGFGYDKDAAQAAQERLVSQFMYIFGRPLTTHAITMGMETDDDSLIFHGENGQTFFVAENLDLSESELCHHFADLYPRMRDRMRSDIVDLVIGNQRHVRTMQAANRAPIELDHREQIIGVGPGFDWLHEPNMALIVGLYDPEWEEWIGVAGGIVLNNFKSGQLQPDAGTMLLISKFVEDGVGSTEWKLAELAAKQAEEKAYAVLKAKVPELLEMNFSVMTGIVDAQTRLLHQL
jgi:hypothetical protein